MKKSKSAGVDNKPAEIVQAGRETIIDVLTKICTKIRKSLVLCGQVRVNKNIFRMA